MALERKRGFYEKYFKRLLDIICSLLAIIVFSWLYVIIAIVVRIKMGSPVLFKQPRPGLVKNGKETIFDMYKFRTMTNEKDEQGNLLPDEKRLPSFGSWLRKTSLDELPEAFNILKGDMSVIGPRPQLIRDMVFMTERQRMRYTAKPGLSGLAQINGRNAITWDDKFEWDLRYIKRITFWNDVRLVFATVKTAFITADGITDGENATAMDYGDSLLKAGKISKTQYEIFQTQAKNILVEYNNEG